MREIRTQESGVACKKDKRIFKFEPFTSYLIWLAFKGMLYDHSFS
jgi:hypothetical protein